MKKIAIIHLLLIYGFVNMGAVIHLHFCMDKLAGWSLWHSAKDKKCIDCSRMENKGACCEDKHEQVKLNTVHQKRVTVQNIQFIDDPVLATAKAEFSLPNIEKSQAIRATNALPKIPGKRLYILYSAFLI